MIFPPITLPEPWSTRYARARAFLYGCAIAVAIVAAFRILFPSQTFLFDFTKPGSLANTLSIPHDTQWASLSDGKISPEQSLLIDAGVLGHSSQAVFTIDSRAKSIPLQGGTVTLHKSYAAFLYPTSTRNAPWPEGTLLTSNGRFALIDTDGKRIDFKSTDQLDRLGYSPDVFLPVTDEEFSRNPEGGTWNSDTDFPSGSLFFIDNNYYQLRNDQLFRFVSEGAYLSRYDHNQAIAKTTDVLDRFPQSEEWIGFRNGTLLQFADGIFFVNQGVIQPIGSPEIFTALGFDWNYVIPASEEEVSVYKRGKVALMNTPQPNGTVFRDSDTGTAYVIADNKKWPIASDSLLRLLTRNTAPIVASSQALDTSATCQLAKDWWESAWSCALPTTPLATLPGNTYQFSVTLDTAEGTRLSQATATFKSTVEASTFRSALSQLKQQIVDRYNR